jgi:GR25 family glycosyltransferase involved in LPS biosynthesis
MKYNIIILVLIILLLVILLSVVLLSKSNLDKYTIQQNIVKKGYIISIDRSYNKRKLNITNLQSFCNNTLSLPYGVEILGIDGENIKDEQDILKKYFNSTKSLKSVNLRLGEIGVYLSHIKIYEDIVTNSYEYCIIFEDDCKIIDHEVFHNHINNAINMCPKNFHLISFFLHPHQEYSSSPYFDKIFNLYKSNTWGLVCYVISLEGAKTFLKTLIPNNGAIDHCIGNQNINKTCFVYKNYSVKLYDTQTFIGGGAARNISESEII